MRISVASSALCLVSAATACSPAADTGSQPVSDARAVQSEFAAESERLTLPPHAGWPPALTVPSQGPGGARQVYQVGYGRVEADLYWYCSWEQFFLKQPAGSPARESAASALLTVRQTYLYQNALQSPDRTFFDDTLNAAIAGHPVRMRDDVAENCDIPPHS
jgi:hypothetical protein